jgi:rhamnulokinase
MLKPYLALDVGAGSGKDMPLTGLARLLQLRSDFLTGRKHIEETVLWGTQLADIRTRDLSRRLLDLFQLPPELFPPRIPPGRLVGEVSPEIAGSAGIGSTPFASVASHDTISALVSAAGAGKEVALLCTGTWFVLGKLVRTPMTEPLALEKGFLNEIAADGLTYLAKNMMGFYLLEGLINEWKMSYELMIQAALEAPEFAIVVDVNDPAFFSSLDPCWDIDDYLHRTGQTPSGGRGPVVRALLEGLAFSCRAALLELKLLTATEVDKIMLLGGGARNPLLCQMIANATNRQLVAGPAEATAVGNLAMQLVASGEADSLSGIHEIITNSFPMPVYEPMAAGRWDLQAKRRARHGK